MNSMKWKETQLFEQKRKKQGKRGNGGSRKKHNEMGEKWGIDETSETGEMG